MKKRSFLPILEAILAVTAWGASFVATKVALRDVSPIVVVWIRFAIGVLILGIAVLGRRQFALPKPKELGFFALLGFIGITFHQWLQSTGLVTAQAISTAWIIATTPIFMAILGWLVLREKLNRRQIIGIILAAGGVLLVVSKGNLSLFIRGGSTSVGDFLIMISAPNWAVFSILSRRVLKENPATRVMFYVMCFGWLFSSVLFFASHGIDDLTHLTFNSWSGILFLGIFCSGLAYIFWYDALKALSASRTGSFLYIEPFVTVIVASIVLAEPLLIAVLAGGLIILLGVWFVNTPNH